MKRLIIWIVGLAAVLGADSCQKELNYLAGDTAVTFEVSADEVATKAIADGTNIDVLYWELYGSDPKSASAPLGEGVVRDNDGDKNFTVNLKLIADQNYNIVFWAQVDGQDHYIVNDLRSVKINSYDDENANDETRAAFFAVYPFSTENGTAINETVSLNRPFAQINLGTTKYETSLTLVNSGKVKVESTEITVSNVANSFNTIDGIGVIEDNFSGLVTFTASETPNGEDDATKMLLAVNGESYYWLGMNYLIVTGNSDNVTVDITINTNMGVVKNSIDNVPVKENHRTNILGNILTTDSEFEIIVDEKFDDDNIHAL